MESATSRRRFLATGLGALASVAVRPVRAAAASPERLAIVNADDFGMIVPTYLSYRQSAILKSAAQQLVTMINVARELALRVNDNVCVKLPSPTTMSYTLGGCSGSIWTGVGTDAAGNMSDRSASTSTGLVM